MTLHHCHALLRFTTNVTGYQTLLDVSQPTAESAAVGTKEPTPQATLYADTPAFDLLRLGYIVKIQPNEEAFAVTVQRAEHCDGAQDNDGSSDNLVVMATMPSLKKALNPQRWPTELSNALPSVAAKGKKFKPVALLQQVRRQRQLALPSTGKEQKVVELATHIEETAILRPVDPVEKQFEPTSTGAVAHLYDVVVDPSATTSKASTVEKSLQRLVDVDAVDTTLLQRALLAISDHAAATSAEVRGIQPTMSMAAACRLLLCQQLMEMICHEAAARYSEEIEPVHQMRVAIRRLRAAAKLFAQGTQRKTLRPYLKLARKTGRLLGAVRNLDVMIAKAQAGKKRSATTKQLKAWRHARAVAHAELLTWLDSEEYRQFLVEFHAYCAADTALEEIAD
ncbi:MAG: CHAD domain-containing protein, partial [Caldilineaceae bacterium]|nr:CHAD domain-containing protein [Caldilineaceae bacterium]